MSAYVDIALWGGVWLGLSTLSYAVLSFFGVVGPDAPVARVIVNHASKLAHLDRPARERAAARIAERTALASAALTGAIVTGLFALIWATS